MSADKRPCRHIGADFVEPVSMTLLEHRLGYRVVAHTAQDGHPGQLQNIDKNGHVDSVRPASHVEIQLYGLLTSGTLGA